jgi:hypothetical protein
MLKKMVFVAALLGSLSVFAVASTAEERAITEQLTRVEPPFVLTLEGKLLYYPHPLEGAFERSAPLQKADQGFGPQILEREPWVGPVLETAGTWFALDFGVNRESKKGEELMKRANKLYGQQVRVTGRLEQRRFGCMQQTALNVLVVTDLQAVKPDGVLKKTVDVKMKGQFLFRADHCDILIPDSRLIVNGKTYVVDYPGNDKVWRSAVALDGHPAIVTGTLEGDTVHATAVKSDADFVQKTVTLELRGRLNRARPMRCLCPEFTLTAGDESFGLEFANDDLLRAARILQNGTVLVTGTVIEDWECSPTLMVTSITADGTVQKP